ncbi:hypothetical protein R6Q59_012399 [Mikania micrantha]
MLKVSPWKGIFRFGKRGKLSPRFVGPFKILERIGSVAYRLELPLELSNIHDVLHISNLKKCLADESLIVPLEEIQMDKKLQFSEEPVEVMDREVKVLKRVTTTKNSVAMELTPGDLILGVFISYFGRETILFVF